VKTPKSILKKLNERKEADSFRSLFIAPKGIDFYSNDYLGIARLQGSESGKHGSTGSRLISGNSAYTEKLESVYSTFFNTDTATLYNSGYDANLGLLSCLPQRGDTIIYDELSHASIRDGIQLSFAKSYNFRHNDLDHLVERLKNATGEVYVLIETVYSMDGDQAFLKGIATCCKEYGAFLIVDEAHSCGVFGDQGNGLVSALELDNLVFAKVITFGKAFGSHGAMVLGSKDLKDYLVNFSRAFIYTTALPPSSLKRLSFALAQVMQADEARANLNANIACFQELAHKRGIEILDSDTAIQGIIIPSNKAVKQKAKQLNEQGFLVKAILSPTVATGQERIRICLHNYNTQKEIQSLIEALI
jgi:8-amino-7-oxononanoate synthase